MPSLILNGKVKIENDLPQEKLFENHQGLNWFDTKGNLIEKARDKIF